MGCGMPRRSSRLTWPSWCSARLSYACKDCITSRAPSARWSTLSLLALALLWLPVAYFPHSNIPVLLPTARTEIQLTRAEFETMIRPALNETVTSMRRGLRSANVTVLNGAEGISEMATGLVAQGGPSSARGAMTGWIYEDEESPDVQAPLVPNSETSRGR